MSMQFSLGKRLLRVAVSLGFLGCLIVAGIISSQAATSESAVVTSKAVSVASVAIPGFCGTKGAAPTSISDFVLSEQVEIGLPDEFGVALEDDDSIEMLRVDIRERTSGGDRAEVPPKFASTTAAQTRPNISPPLLV